MDIEYKSFPLRFYIFYLTAFYYGLDARCVRGIFLFEIAVSGISGLYLFQIKV